MNGFTTTVQLPAELNSAIKKAVKAAISEAKDSQDKAGQFPPYMNLKDTAKYLGVSYNNLKKIVASHDDFPITSLNGTYRVNRLALDKFMLDNK